MGLIEALIVIVVVGVVTWALLLIPLEPPFPTLIKVVAVLFVLLYILRGTGLLGAANIHV